MIDTLLIKLKLIFLIVMGRPVMYRMHIKGGDVSFIEKYGFVVECVFNGAGIDCANVWHKAAQLTNAQER